MDLQSRKISFIQAFLSIQDEAIISRFEQLLSAGKSESPDKAPVPMSLEQLKRDICQSLADSTQDNVTSSEELLNQISNWK